MNKILVKIKQLWHFLSKKLMKRKRTIRHHMNTHLTPNSQMGRHDNHERNIKTTDNKHNKNMKRKR